MQIFAIIDDTSVMNFRKNLQYDFPKNEGGGSKTVWNFSENSSVLEGKGVPKTYVKYILEDSLWTLSVWKWGLFGRRGRATIRVFLLKTILTFPWAPFLNAHCFKSEAVARQQELHLQMIV